MTPPLSPIQLFGTSFQNPVLLASGTAGFGREVSGVIDLDVLGGIVTKAVTPEPRRGAPAPRVAEFAGGMLNAVGLANPGLDASHRPRDKRADAAFPSLSGDGGPDDLRGAPWSDRGPHGGVDRR